MKTISIVVNSQPRRVASATGLLQLIEELGLSPNATLVERNGKVVLREEYPQTTLAEGDRLEFIRIVGGG
ncbi:MAG: sulfur carrier protein ThiS [bacterium]